MAWNLKYDGAVPPIPGAVKVSARSAAAKSNLSRLRAGCWFVRVRPDLADDVKDAAGPVCYEGTLRLEREDKLRGSGDLYLCRVASEDEAFSVPRKIPSFPVQNYRYYFGVKEATVLSKSIRFVIAVYRFESEHRSWVGDGDLTANLTIGRVNEPLKGSLKNELGENVASITMGWVSKQLRRAVVEMNRVDRVSYPRRNDQQQTLQALFEQVGWDVTLRPRANADNLVEEPCGSVWPMKELHKHMLKWRSEHRDEPSSEWYYHVLCVRKIRRDMFWNFGLMYDAWAADSNHVPREGVAVAARARFPFDRNVLDKPRGRPIRGRTLGSMRDLYLRTVIHELGHAMGLAHHFEGKGFMQGTKNLVDKAEASNLSIAETIAWEFHPDEALRLRHLPDHWVRPGGVPFLSGFTYEPVPVEDLTKSEPKLKLLVEPFQEVLPLGAPLRLTLELRNVGKEHVKVPPDISLKSGHARGSVRQEGGALRSFGTIVRYVQGGSPEKLAAGEHVVRSETLLRGEDGALLPSPGVYRVEAEIVWDVGGGDRRSARGETSVLVSGPQDRRHAEAALAALQCGELMLPLVFRSETPTGAGLALDLDLQRAIEALQGALLSDVLWPHFASIEAKRRAGVQPWLVELAKLIAPGTIMTGSEIASIADLLSEALPIEMRIASIREAMRTCLNKINEVKCSPAERERVEKLEKKLAWGRPTADSRKSAGG